MCANVGLIWFESGAAMTAVTASVLAAGLTVLSAVGSFLRPRDPSKELLRPAYNECATTSVMYL